jgi:hypothetical protein
VDALARGHFLKTACALAGVTPQAFHYWRRRWEKGDPDAQGFADFFVAVGKASAEAEIEALEKLLRGGPGWRAQAWFLERRFPRRWGARTKAEVSKPSGGPILIDAEARAQAARELAEWRKEMMTGIGWSDPTGAPTTASTS